MDKKPIISAKDVEITFSLRGKKLKAIRKCSLDLYEGETLAIVGESGSGKSVFTKTFVGMLDANGKITGGSIMYDGEDVAKYKEKDWLKIRGKKIAMVMQDPMTSLNPLKKVGKQIQESIEHHQGLKGAEAKKAAIEMLAKVGIPDPERRYDQYPHEFSGGMRQRVVIAIAAACHPQVLICDEPTTALDVTTQADIMELIRERKAVVLLNKSDLEPVVSLEEIAEKSGHRVISISAKEETGIDQLEEEIKSLFYEGKIDFNDQILITNVRHAEALREAYDSIRMVENSIESGMPEDFFSIDLMNAYEKLGLIVGESVEDDLVNEIFSKFCMGK